ncbi:conserved hypothetical protein [Leishmania major strain Friedlin]|uniref:Uncharacterized protein n=1 Tax=Leishmania major TaxID=5664 RepID=Q4QBM1_LEIMA|nr:conserved hypothetical protein [Leishmania major strain Friedlin]CAG9573992.1 hypothetical_protein_-_conserved [Leishmania major strain Friedlin]CAJ04638.2 conserved hypothetical protein [Leishmania major strain Friedlin]|eukprot:XP_001683277.2 conserved hypothetical protein [Leishmania major strain Friedlin]
MMSQSLSTYSLVQCVVSAAQFTSGEISFYDTYAELTAADADGNSTSPLRVVYDVLEHFRIVRAQGVMRLTLPRGVVRRWAAQNTFETQLDEYEGEQTGVDDGNGAEAGAVSGQMTTSTVVLLLQLGVEDMAAFMRSIAPLIAASRRTRSVSRISVTEPLPVYGVPLVDPAASVPTDAATSPRAVSTSSASSQEEVAEIDSAGGENSAAPVCGRRHHRRQWQRRGERDTAHCTPSCTGGGGVEERRGCASAKHSEARRTTAAARDAALCSPETVAELLGDDSDDSPAGVAEAEVHGDAVQTPSGSPASPAGGEEEGGGTANQTPRVAGALAITATATTGAAAQVDRRLSSPKHRQSQQATPSRLANTLEGVAEELAELMEEAEQHDHCLGGRGGPLHRRRLTVAAVMTAVRPVGQQQASRCTHRQPLPIVALSAAPSVCPSLKSTISEAHVLSCPHRQQSPSAAAVKLQCEVNGVHAAAAAYGGPVVENRRSTQRPMGMAAHVQGRCSARVVRNGGGGAHLCASEVTFTAAAELPRLATHDACDDRAATQEGHAMPSPEPEETRDDVSKAAAASGSAICDVRGVRHAGDGWAGPETQWAALCASTATHVFSNAGKEGCRGDACTAPAATPTRKSSRSSSAASSVKLGDMLAVPSAVHEPGSAAEGVIEPSRRTVQFRVDGADALLLKPSLPYARNSGAADVVAYLRELFPVEDTVPKPMRQRRKVQTAPAAGSVRGLSAFQRCRRAPARSAVTHTASATGAVASNLVFTGAADKAADGATAPPLPVKAAPSPPLSLPTKLSDKIGAAAATRATTSRRRRSSTVGALGTAKKRAKVSTATAADPSDNSMDAAEDAEKNTEATAGGGACGNGATACLTTPPHPGACSTVSVPRRVTVSVRDADALGLVQAPLPLRSAASAAKPSAVMTAFAAAAEGEAAAYAAVEEGAAAAALAGDAAKVTGGLIRGPSTEAGSREVPRDAEHRRGTQLPPSQLVVHEVAPPAECADGTSRHYTAGVAADHCDKNGGRSSISISSSQATCPLLYCRESRKERSRRVLRYMNLISQSIAAVHETHDALRGLLLLMMEQDQL